VKLFLVNPSCLDTRLSEEDALSVPMGLYYIGALLKENRIDTTIINLAVETNPMDTLAGRVAADKPKIIGISVLNATRFGAMEAARTAKSIDPSVTIVFGGPGATFLAEHFLYACPEIDFIVLGEGEFTFLDLATHIMSKNTDPLNHIPGLAFRAEDGIIKTSPRELISDLDILPHPGRYFDAVHISLSRGCPGRCRFCGSPDFWGKGCVRFHSAKWFVDHLEHLVNRGITHFFVSDDTFTMDKRLVIDVCSTIVSRKLNITWSAISRVDFIDEEILFQMRKAGCIQLSFGIESGSETIRKTLGKPVKRERIIRAFQLTNQAGILTRAYFIYGSPGETEQTVQESIDLLLEIKPLSVIFYMLVIFPGTAIYRDLVDRSMVTDDIWHQPIEDIPWFQLDPDLDFNQIKSYGKRLRQSFYGNLEDFASTIKLLDNRELYPCHGDFLSRLAMTFSHGEYAKHPQVLNPGRTARLLYEKALSYHDDPRAFLGLAMLYQKNKDFHKAISILEKGLACFPEIKNLNLCMAVSLMNTGRFKKALTYLEPFRNDPDITQYINACNNRGAQ